MSFKLKILSKSWISRKRSYWTKACLKLGKKMILDVVINVIESDLWRPWTFEFLTTGTKSIIWEPGPALKQVFAWNIYVRHVACSFVEIWIRKTSWTNLESICWKFGFIRSLKQKNELTTFHLNNFSVFKALESKPQSRNHVCSDGGRRVITLW